MVFWPFSLKNSLCRACLELQELSNRQCCQAQFYWWKWTEILRSGQDVILKFRDQYFEAQREPSRERKGWSRIFRFGIVSKKSASLLKSVIIAWWKFLHIQQFSTFFRSWRYRLETLNFPLSKNQNAIRFRFAADDIFESLRGSRSSLFAVRVVEGILNPTALEALAWRKTNQTIA